MEFRVTVNVGQDSVDPAVLDQRAGALQRQLPAGAVVVVDPVKAAIQVVAAVHVDDALQAVQQAVHITTEGLNEAGLQRPATILTVEAEAVAGQLAAEQVRPHPVP